MKKYLIQLWSGHLLAREIDKGTISEERKFIYFFIVFFSYSLLRISFERKSSELWSIDSQLLELLIISFGLTTSYISHHYYGNKKNFIEKFICLLIPAFIRSVVIVFIPLFFVYSLLAITYQGDFATFALDFHLGAGIGVISYIYFFYYIGKSLTSLRH